MTIRRVNVVLVAIIAGLLASGCSVTDSLVGAMPAAMRDAAEKLRAGNATGAFAELDKAIAERPNDPTVYLAAAQVCLEGKRPDRAVTYAERGLQASPGAKAAIHAQLHSIKGTALLEMGDVKGSVPSHRAAWRLMPEEPVYLNNLAFALAELAENDVSLAEAEQLARDAVDKATKAQAPGQTLGVFLDTLGWVQFRRGDLHSASVNLAQAADLAPGEAEILYHLACLRLAEGRRADAIVWLQRAVKIKPDLGPAKKLLDEVTGYATPTLTAPKQ